MNTPTLFDLPNNAAPRPSSEPAWLTAYTTRTGADPNPRLAGTRAIPRPCPTCARLTLTGYDAPLIAGLATTDPYLLTPNLEAAALILARPTYQLWGAPGRYELTPRSPIHITGLRLPSADHVPVVAAHDCPRPPLSTTPLPMHALPPTHDGPPPF